MIPFTSTSNVSSLSSLNAMCDSECLFLYPVFPVASLLVECNDCSQSNNRDDSYTLNLQSSVNITCNNTASTDLDSFEFTWKKDNIPLSGDKYSITHISQVASRLMFEITNFTDAGVYKCLIGNSVGSNSKIVHINVLCECCNLFLHSSSLPYNNSGTSLLQPPIVGSNISGSYIVYKGGFFAEVKMY